MSDIIRDIITSRLLSKPGGEELLDAPIEQKFAFIYDLDRWEASAFLRMTSDVFTVHWMSAVDMWVLAHQFGTFSMADVADPAFRRELRHWLSLLPNDGHRSPLNEFANLTRRGYSVRKALWQAAAPE